jgi:hypothetical protein
VSVTQVMRFGERMSTLFLCSLLAEVVSIVLCVTWHYDLDARYLLEDSSSFPVAVRRKIMGADTVLLICLSAGSKLMEVVPGALLRIFNESNWGEKI